MSKEHIEIVNSTCRFLFNECDRHELNTEDVYNIITNIVSRLHGVLNSAFLDLNPKINPEDFLETFIKNIIQCIDYKSAGIKNKKLH